MKKITALLFLPLLTMTAGEDTTKIQVKNIFDTFQLFHKQTIEKSYADWILQHRPFETPSKLINSTNITFTKFIPDEEILSISNLNTIKCDFKQNLEIQFHPGKNISIKGDAKSLHSENISSCRIIFNFNLIRVTATLKMQNLDKMTNKSGEIVFLDSNPNDIENFTITKLESESCSWDVDQEQFDKHIYQAINDAINDIIKERFKSIAELVFELLLNNCMHPQLDQNKDNYLRFKLEPNMDMFPLYSDYNELTITGLNNFARLEVYYSIFSQTDYYIFVYDIKIHWEIMSVTMKKFDFEASYTRISAALNMPIDYLKVNLLRIDETNKYDHIRDSKDGAAYTAMLGTENRTDYVLIFIPRMSEKRNGGEIEIKLTERKKLVKLIVAGIEQTLQEIRCHGTQEFVNSFRKILAPFDEKIFENLVNDLEKSTSRNSFSSFSKIEMKVNSHFENITCRIDDYYQKIGKITYKNIKGQANFIHEKTFDGFKKYVLEFANVYIEQVNFVISLRRYMNQTKEIIIQIDDDFKVAEVMISFYSKLPRGNRILVGNLILEDFVKLFRDRINNTVNSVFHPFLNACPSRNISKNVTEPSSNYFANLRQYFAFMRGFWTAPTRLSTAEPVSMIINGTWNLKNISMQFINENLVVEGLKMENVTGEIKLYVEPEKFIIVPYNWPFLAFRIHHANNLVIMMWSEITQKKKLNIGFGITEVEIFQKVGLLAAQFIGISIYGESINYYAKQQILVEKTLKELAQEDVPMVNDMTSVFVNNIAKTLKSIPQMNIHHTPEKILLLLERGNHFSNLSTLPSEIEVNFEYPMVYARETCDNFNYSQNVSRFGEDFILYGNIQIQEKAGSRSVLSRIPFIANRHRVINISSKENQYDGELQIKINTKKTIIRGNFEPNDEDILKKNFTQIAGKFAQTRLKSITFPSNICSHRFGSLKPPSKNHFYLISNTINDASRYFLGYYIKLYGLYNLKSLTFQLTDINYINGFFKIIATNLTAQVIWNYHINNLFHERPKKMEFHIDQISLAGEIWNRAKRLTFTNVTLQLLSQQNSTSTEFNKMIEYAITDSIIKSVKKQYLND